MPSIEVVQPQPAARPLDLLEPVERLPSEQSRKWFEALQQRRVDALTLFQSVAGELREVRAEVYAAEARRKALVMPKSAGGAGLTGDDTSVVDIDRTIAAAKARVGRLSELANDRNARLDRVGSVLRSCEDFLRKGGVPGGVKIAAATPVVSVKDVLRKNESARDAVARMQLRGREIAADQHRERSRPFPSAFAKQRSREIIAARARAPSVTNLIEHGTDFTWPTTIVRLSLAAITREQAPVVGNATDEAEDPLGLICWLMGDKLAEAIDGLIDAEADDAEASTQDEKAVRLAELEYERLAIERQEAAVVWSMQEAGEAVEHRSDISPLALLGLELLTVA